MGDNVMGGYMLISMSTVVVYNVISHSVYGSAAARVDRECLIARILGVKSRQGSHLSLV